LRASIIIGAAVGGPFEDSVAAYQRGDYATALRLLDPLAEHGTADAQFNLGIIYNKGQGVYLAMSGFNRHGKTRNGGRFSVL
jgi:hypothetical protein